MKLISFEFENREIAGVFLDYDNNTIVTFKDLIGQELSMLEFLKTDLDNSFKIINKKLESGHYNKISLDEVKLLSPIPYPFRNIICLGKNYLDHVKELSGFTGKGEIPERPIYFTKSAYPAVSPNGEIDSHKNITKCLDYEVELAVVIGKRCKNVTEKEAGDYILGYTILNDISARDIQKNHGQWFKGKSLDNTCPIGPYIVTKDEIKHPLELDISSKVNGELRQSSNTKNMIFSIPFVISELSSGMELFPGDIIATGTPKGVGQGFDPPKYLKSGDEVICSVEKLGELKNTII